jgi:amino acid transporter
MASYKHGEKVDDFVSSVPITRTDSHEEGEIVENNDHLHRRLGNRQIQLMAIGGTIGTALFVSIGSGLYKGGPGSLFLAYTIYACFLGLVNNCIAEMTTAYPVSGGFIRLAGHFVDDAFGFMAGYNCEWEVRSFEANVLIGVSSLHLRGAPDPLRDYCSVNCTRLLE